MVFFTLRELVDLIIMVLAIGYIFSKIFRKKVKINNNYDPLKHYKESTQLNFIQDLKYGIIVAAPAVVLHELAHKFVGLAFGATAILHAPLKWYALVILLILMNSPFIFFVGGYVEIIGSLTNLQYSLIAFAGPFTNLLLWILIKYILINTKTGKKNLETLLMMSKINMFLFIFNILPIPGFDGYSVFRGLFALFSGLI